MTRLCLRSGWVEASWETWCGGKKTRSHFGLKPQRRWETVAKVHQNYPVASLGSTQRALTDGEKLGNHLFLSDENSGFKQLNVVPASYGTWCKHDDLYKASKLYARCQHWLAAAYLQLTWPRQNHRVSNVKSTITRDASTGSTWSAHWANNGIFNMQRLMAALIFRHHQQPAITSLKDWENPGKFLPVGANEPTNRTRIPLTSSA